MSKELAPIRGVSQNYGTREVGGGLGHVKTEGARNQLTVEVTGVDLKAGIYNDVVLPKGSFILSATASVKEAFDLGGTAPTISVGTEGSETTNGVRVSEAQAELVDTYDISGTAVGEWTGSLDSDTTVNVILSGTNPTVTNDGRVVIVIDYFSVA